MSGRKSDYHHCGCGRERELSDTEHMRKALTLPSVVLTDAQNCFKTCWRKYVEAIIGVWCASLQRYISSIATLLNAIILRQ